MRAGQRRRRPGGGSGARRLTGVALAALLLVSGNTAAVQAAPERAAPAEGTSLPALVPRDGTYLEGTEHVAATPTLAGDSVTKLADAHGRPGGWGPGVPVYPWFTSTGTRR